MRTPPLFSIAESVGRLGMLAAIAALGASQPVSAMAKAPVPARKLDLKSLTVLMSCQQNSLVINSVRALTPSNQQYGFYEADIEKTGWALLRLDQSLYLKGSATGEELLGSLDTTYGDSTCSPDGSSSITPQVILFAPGVRARYTSRFTGSCQPVIDATYGTRYERPFELEAEIQLEGGDTVSLGRVSDRVAGRTLSDCQALPLP